ncbi:phosphonate ABC transporter [Synechococcus sp. A10-1-5-1]|uniref:phosphonate ABC transporter n=1 Tax=Synechococcus sp. A10-1-5-1 TaxID=2936507 RepID=UPI002001BDE6|nr:phosphonate ABC transporter [Synechococcus sp. A10-1-5-1]UPM50721.1 phosphonate ABC transporter [Synechococcus sp. A10-1-5-1]
MKVAAPLQVLIPAVVILPLAVVLPGLCHGGGWDLIGAFAAAALQPSFDPIVLASLLKGLGVTVGVALLSWSLSLLLGLVLGLASSRLVWTTLIGGALPAELLRRLLALPRSIHELIWGLLLLQVLGLQPAVAVLAIVIPYSALVARVISDQLDALPDQPLKALLSSGSGGPAALITAIGPPLLPGVISYGGYRLECALRSATLLGVFGLGGLGNELLLTLQSLEFHELWSGLWLLLAVMLSLESLIRTLRKRWGLANRFGRRQAGVGRRGQEILILFALLVPLLLAIAQNLGIDPAALLHWQPLPPMDGSNWQDALALPWGRLISNTLWLTLLSACLAVGGAPLLLVLVAPWPLGQQLLRLLWALGRLWPPPLTALLLLFVFQPGLWTAALALGFHNLGILGRLLLEGTETCSGAPEDALHSQGVGPRIALLYGRLSALARSYLAYGAYRSDVILRETVVVGMMAGTGLGTQLQESLSSFAWDQISLLLVVYAALTLVGEDLSDRARRRLL